MKRQLVLLYPRERPRLSEWRSRLRQQGAVGCAARLRELRGHCATSATDLLPNEIGNLKSKWKGN